MKALFSILLLICTALTQAQQGFTFSRFTTEDNSGLSSNVVSSIYQDEKGFIWVGNANGLQRFDGNKFIRFDTDKKGSDVLPYSAVTQIIPVDTGKLILNFGSLKEIGIFNIADFSYKKVAIKPARSLTASADFLLWKDSKGELYLNVFQYGVLHYNKRQNAFIEDKPFPFPTGYTPALNGVYDDVLKQQVWFVCEKGICVYDRGSRQMWYRDYNPQRLPILNNETVQDRPSEIFIDRSRRFWIFGWPLKANSQVKYCLDSTGNYLHKDTAGLNKGPIGYTEYTHFFETVRSGLWIYGVGNLFNWDKNNQRFYFTKSSTGTGVNSIEYDNIHQVLEDRDGNIWIASDKGLYFTPYGSGTFSVINLLFNETTHQRNITDILEMPDGELWFSSWGEGVIALDASFKEKQIPLYNTAPPIDWPELSRNSVILTWNLHRQQSTGNVLIGCANGGLLIYNPANKTTEYLLPPAVNHSTIRFITEDALGQIWLGTQSGRLVKWNKDGFTLVQNIGTIIYKIFIDKQGVIWLATQEKGLYALDGKSGKVIKQYTANGGPGSLYSNTGWDVEQLNDSTIVYGAGALNFINKKTGKVRQLRYEDGLPSNSVKRLRMDSDGFLWIITSNGLSRYNPFRDRITTYGRKDGITLAAKTTTADYLSRDNYIVFGGSNAVMLFKPSLFATNQAPPDVIITDFRIFNQFIPVDSLLKESKIKLSSDNNSFSIYFSSLSYQQRDRLTYYFKMEGIDKDWTEADGVLFQSYSLLPPGEYTFKVYAENVEGIRSAHTTEFHIVIKPPFWRTKWFISTAFFLLLLLIYFLHSERVNRLLAVEKLRNRVARDLHDDMGSALSTINILSAMAKSKMSTDAVKTASYISKISDNSQRMMEAMDDIVWSIKPSNDSMQKVVARMREFATSVLEAKDILLHFSVAEEVHDIKLNMEARRDFFLIFKEALNNAAKYSKATEVWIEIALQNRQLSFTIKDNGIGFDVAKADSGNGLGNMQKRADGVNGKIRISSKEGDGTLVRLTIPASF